MTTLGKYLAGGLSFGAFGGRDDLMAAFDPDRVAELTHGGTFNNNVVTMAGGVAALSELLRPTSSTRCSNEVRICERRTRRILERSTLPLSVTGMGSMFTIHSVAGAVRSPADLVGADEVLEELLFHHLVERGIFLAARGFVVMSLAINDADLRPASSTPSPIPSRPSRLPRSDQPGSRNRSVRGAALPTSS